MLFIFSFWSSKFSRLYCREAPSKSSQGFTLFFLTFLSFDHSFTTGVLHGGSTWWFVKDSFHSSIVLQDFSWSYDPPSILKIKQGAQHMFYSEEFEYSSSCIPKCNSFYLIFWGAVRSLLTISFMFHDSYVVKNEVF